MLRNEDLDEQRSRAEFYLAMIEDLRWLGIRWQEGPDAGGKYGPYSQSERRTHYLAAWRKLVDGGFVYPCQCSRKELAMAAIAPHENGDDEPVYPGTCRWTLERSEWKMREDPAGVNWRFRVPDDETVAFDDEHFGRQKFVAGRDFGDFLVWRRDGVPAYQLACVADDAAMRITEVVRGANLLKSTARQILLYRALELEIPAWYHCSLLTDATGRRLAKRHDALSIRRLREDGKTPSDVVAMTELSTDLRF